MKYLGKVSIAEDDDVIIDSINPDITICSGMRIVICDRDGELIGVIPEDGEFKGESSPDGPEIPELPKDYGMRVPEGIAKNGDSDLYYHGGKCYRVTIQFEVTEEIS